MKLSKTCGGRGVSSLLNRVFPFRLRYRLGVQNAAAAFGRGRFSFRAKTKTGSRSFGGDNNRRERGQTKSLVELTELITDSPTVTPPQTDRRGGESVDLGTRGGSGTNEFSNSKRPRDDSGGHFDDTRNGTSSKIPRKGGPMSSASTPFLRVHSDEDEELSPRGRANGAQGAAVSSPVSKGGTAVDSQSSYARGGNVQTGGKHHSLLTTDEDKEGEMSSFSNLLSDEEDSHVDDDLKGLELTQEDNVQKPEPKTSAGQNDLKGLRLTQEDNVQRPAPKTSTGQTGFYLSETRFDQCSVSPLTLKGIKDAGYERMTVVQEATLPVILKGKDILAKAKTGTGKTLAFLLPAIEAIVRSPPIDRDQERPPVFVLVICPTRELASQAAVEANTLLKYHPSFGVQVVIGGVRLASEQKRLQANPCQILVATPGRLADHIKNTAGFSTQLMGVKVLVLDEADRLLDMGFRKDIENIIAAIPKQRQTLLFSATVPQEVRQICQVALKRDHEYINTVEEGSEETHSQVTQMHLVAPLDEHFSLLYVLLKEHISDDVDYKVIVFCTTAMVTKLVASLLSELNLNVREIHSRKNQSYRKRVSDEFRKSKGLILVTSDVSARGVDYPDVTLVIQVGLPSDREQYIHRLGRTGRKGKEGQGILLLAPWEAFFLSKLKDLPITKASSVPGVDPDTKKKVERALSLVDMNCKESAYQAWLGFYNSNKTVGKNKCGLVKLANEFSRSMGLDNPPAIPELVLGKMGLYNVPGLRCKSPEFPWSAI